ncbi:MAG: phosphonate C-P lyase system protein PhnH [Candidatus Competibacteraceae bacterium]
MMLEVASIWKPAVQQRNFRALLAAMSRPGQVKPILRAEDDNNAAIAVLATLLDGSVTLADPDGLLRDDERPLLQAECAGPQDADYILCAGHKTLASNPNSAPWPAPGARRRWSFGGFQQARTQLRTSAPASFGHMTALRPAWMLTG